jgi:hypothetical protein
MAKAPQANAEMSLFRIPFTFTWFTLDLNLFCDAQSAVAPLPRVERGDCGFRSRSFGNFGKDAASFPADEVENPLAYGFKYSTERRPESRVFRGSSTPAADSGTTFKEPTSSFSEAGSLFRSGL